MNRAFGYVRVSGKGQVDGDGPERQELAIREYAKAHGLEVVEVFMDGGVSGTVEDRPALADMMVSLEQNGHGIKTVIIEKLDRLARDLMVQEGIIRDFQQHGIELISAIEGADLLSNDPTRKLVRQVLGAIAEYDKQMLVLKLRAARRRVKARQGKCEGRKSTQELNPGIIAEIGMLRRLNKAGKRRPWNEVAEALNARGHKTATGKPWTGPNVSLLMSRVRASKD